LLIFDFAALLTLIALTNIVSTAVTNMRLRNRDFALLRAVGTSKRNFAKMLRFENLLSSVRAVLIGIPLGSAFVLHFGFMQSAEFPFSYPWLAAAISIDAYYFGTGTLLRHCSTRTASRQFQRRS
jgi:putative ABC transport system permease protein